MIPSLQARVVCREILDGLAPQDPRAVRSRWDLRVLDVYLGNSRWITRSLRAHRPRRIAEIGAGEGHLAARLAGEFPGAQVEGYDLAPPPLPIPRNVRWVQGNFLETLDSSRDVIVGALILHHLVDDDLKRLGERLRRAERLIFAEPARVWSALLAARLVGPLVGEVTRHDMPASIRAGFRVGELGDLLGLGDLRIEETIDPRGTLRFQAWRD